jgi:hypothetical protein
MELYNAHSGLYEVPMSLVVTHSLSLDALTGSLILVGPDLISFMTGFSFLPEY